MTDHIIVGAGSAGCAMAYRLAEAGRTVTVIEYGGTDAGPLIQMPAALSFPMNMARYGDGGAFWPSDPVMRASVDQWAEWGKVEWQRGFSMPIFWARVRVAASERSVDALRAAEVAHLRRCDLLEAQLEGDDFVCGAFSLADVVIGHVLFRHDAIGLPMGLRLRAYYDRLTGRPAFREHVMVSYDALRHPEASG